MRRCSCSAGDHAMSRVLSSFTVAATVLVLVGCGSPELISDYDGVEKTTVERLVRGDVDLAAFYFDGVFRITKPEVKDEGGYRDLDEPAFAAEVERVSKLAWERPPSAALIYHHMRGTEHGFPPETWARVKKLLRDRGFRPVLLVYNSPLSGPAVGWWPFRRSDAGKQ